MLGMVAVLGACGAGDDSGAEGEGFEPFSLVASTDLAVGENRFLLAFREADGTPLGSPEEAASMRLYPEGQASSAQVVRGTFVWIVPDVTGLYRAAVSLHQPGIWTVEADLSGTPIAASSFVVKETGDTPAVGETPPRSITPTVADYQLAEITTDPDPDPAFYALSVDEALDSGVPSVIVFSTPAFCVTQACGPMLDLMKTIRADWPDVNWVHVEVFENIQDPANRRYVSAVTEWALPTEPWVFITDDEGIVAASFEGVVDTQEVEGVLRELDA